MLRAKHFLHISALFILVLLIAQFGMQWLSRVKSTTTHLLGALRFSSTSPTVTQVPMDPANLGTMSTMDLLTLDASALQALMKEGKLTSVSLVEQLLAQIGREDREGANLKAILSIAPRDILLRTATQLDSERKEGKLRSPLHGIPVLVKDAIATDPSLGMPTTVGSYALLSSKPAKSATVVEKLIENGLIILGKTNMNEFCNWKGFGSINGWSAVGGQTNSAYVIGGLKEGETSMGNTSPLGSSTGSAVGVSAGFSPVALGTETDGSIVQPAGRAALFALKPTVGSVYMDGTWTLSKSFDSIGALAKSTLDLALVTEMIMTEEARAKFPAAGLTSYLTKTFHGLKVGFLNPAEYRFAPEMCPEIPEVRQQLDATYFETMEKLRADGATVEYPIPFPLVSELAINGMTAMSTILFHDYENNVNEYLGGLASSEVRTLEELIKWNKEHADIEMPTESANQDRLIAALNSTITTDEFDAAKQHLYKVSREQGFDPLFDERGFDIIAILMDSKIPSMATASGYPIASLPLGILDYNGRPFALAIMAKAGREDLIFQFMSAFEKKFPKRVVPPQLVRSSGMIDSKI